MPKKIRHWARVVWKKCPVSTLQGARNKNEKFQNYVGELLFQKFKDTK